MYRHEWVDQPIVLDSVTLSLKQDRKLFCTQKVQVETEVTPAQLEQGLSSLICEGGIYCPLELKESLAKLCDLLKTSATFYIGIRTLAGGRSRDALQLVFGSPGWQTDHRGRRRIDNRWRR